MSTIILNYEANCEKNNINFSSMPANEVNRFLSKYPLHFAYFPNLPGSALDVFSVGVLSAVALFGALAIVLRVADCLRGSRVGAPDD